MAATLELKYFNSFWLKRLKTMEPVRSTTTTGIVKTLVTAGNNVFELVVGNDQINSGDTMIRSNIAIGTANVGTGVGQTTPPTIFVRTDTSTNLNAGTILTFKVTAQNNGTGVLQLEARLEVVK